MPPVPILTVRELVDMKTPFCLIDVREPEEVALCQIPNSLSIPLAEIGQRINEVPHDKPIILYCHHGRRSERAAQYLLQQGFVKAVNLEGGIDAWAVHIDPSMVRY